MCCVVLLRCSLVVLLVDVCCSVILCCYVVVLCLVCCLYGKSIWYLSVHTYFFYIEIVDNLLMVHGMLWCVFLCFGCVSCIIICVISCLLCPL